MASYVIEVPLEGEMPSSEVLFEVGRMLLGSRLLGVATGGGLVKFPLTLPESSTDRETCQALAFGDAVISVTMTPSAPTAGDNVAVAVVDPTGEYNWTWELNGAEIDSDATSGILVPGDYTIDALAIESGVHVIRVTQAGKAGYLKVEVD